MRFHGPVHPTLIHRSLLLGNCRGAVFLLAVYLTALVLLLLSGISLLRTSHEQRMAQLSRNQHQAFWLAEAALDGATAQIQRASFQLPYNVPTTATGQSGSVLTAPVLQGQVLSNTTQQLLRQLNAVGTVNGIANRLNETVNALGALRGVWADGYVVVHGGRDHPGAFLTADLYSSLGTLVSVVPNNTNTLTYDGLVSADKIGLSNPETATAQQKLDALRSPTASSSELQDLKTTYLKLEGLREDKTSVTSVKFVTGTDTGTSQHVTGLLSVGMTNIDVDYARNACHVVMTPRAGQVTDVYDGFRGGNDLRDLGPIGDGKIVLCVRAIVPGDVRETVPQGNPNTEGLKAVLLPPELRRPPFLASGTPTQPAELRFHAPATVYITGNQSFDIPELSYLSPDINTTWKVSLAVKISSVNDADPTKPNPVTIVQTIPRRDRRYQPGMYFVKPSALFAGLIYSPHSLVVMRARDADDLGAALKIQAIVGHEVVVELESDQASIGSTMADGSSIPSDTTTVTSWQNQ